MTTPISSPVSIWFVYYAFRGMWNADENRDEDTPSSPAPAPVPALREKKSCCQQTCMERCISCFSAPPRSGNRTLFRPCAKFIPCLQKFPSASSTHLGRDRCPTLTYLLIAWQFVVVLIATQWHGNETSLCKLHYHVDTNTSLLAVLNDNASYVNGSALGAQLGSYETLVPSFFDDRRLEDATFVFADEIMPFEREIKKAWYEYKVISATEYTWPTPNPNKDYYNALITLAFFLVTSGANAYSNRWFGWASFMWVLAIVIHGREVFRQLEDLRFCRYDCLNANGERFDMARDVPEYVHVAVHQNGTCDNSYQRSHDCIGECGLKFDLRYGSSTSVESGSGLDFHYTDVETPPVADADERYVVCQAHNTKPYCDLNPDCEFVPTGDITGCPINTEEASVVVTEPGTKLVTFWNDVRLLFEDTTNTGDALYAASTNAFPAPYSGCSTWRKTVRIPTATLQVVDYAANRPSLWNSMNTALDGALQLGEQVDQIETCFNDSVVTKVSEIAVNCGLHANRPLVDAFETCVAKGGDSGGVKLGDGSLEMAVKTCVDITLLESFRIVSKGTSESWKSFDNLKSAVTSAMLDNMQRCLDSEMGYCLVTTGSSEQCAAKCAKSILSAQQQNDAKLNFDQEQFLNCVSQRLPDAEYNALQGPLSACAGTDAAASSLIVNPKALSDRSREAYTCMAGALINLAESACVGSNTFDIDHQLLQHLYSASGVGTESGNMLKGLVTMARSHQQGTNPLPTIPFREAVQRHVDRCDSYLAGNGTAFSHSQSVILQSVTLALMSLGMFILLIFIFIDAVWMVSTRSSGLRTRLCNKCSSSSHAITCGVSLFFLCDDFSSGVNRCLYACRLRTRKSTNLDDGDDGDDEGEDDGDGDENIQGAPMSEHGESKSADERQGAKNRTSQSRTPMLAEELEIEDDKEDDVKIGKGRGKRCCRAMPPTFVASVIATSLVLVWNFQLLLALSQAWRRWSIVLGDAIWYLPNNVDIMYNRLQKGNMTTPDDVYAYYGNPVPDGVPSAVRQFVHSFVSWFVTSGTVEALQDNINNDDDSMTIWQIVFRIVYYILCYTVVCTFIATFLSAICYVFRTRSLWKRISSVSRAQKKIIWRYFHPEKGWQEMPSELTKVLKAAGSKAPIPHHFKYQSLPGSAPFPALFFWMNIGAFWVQYVAVMVVLLVPVAILVLFVLYNIWTSIHRGHNALDGLKTALNFFETTVSSQAEMFVVLQIIRYSIRWTLYSRSGGIRHPFYESCYQYLTTLLYLLSGMYQLYLRFAYSLLSFAFRIGKMDVDLVGFGQDYSYNAYLGMLESVRLKNEFEKVCEHVAKSTPLGSGCQIVGDGGAVAVAAAAAAAHNHHERPRGDTEVAVANVSFDLEARVHRGISSELAKGDMKMKRKGAPGNGKSA
jgi:hypothetical protein